MKELKKNHTPLFGDVFSHFTDEVTNIHSVVNLSVVARKMLGRFLSVYCMVDVALWPLGTIVCWKVLFWLSPGIKLDHCGWCVVTCRRELMATATTHFR